MTHDISKFKGVGVALVTPFLANHDIDFNGLRALVRLQIEGGTDFLVVQGTTGESPVLSEDEKDEILKTVIDENAGRLPVVYGIGGNNTKLIADKLAKISANNPGVDGILSVSPYYNKPTQEGIYQHFKALSDATTIPIILYNVPGRTGSNVLVETTLRCATLANIVAVKEASGSIEQIMQIIQRAPKDFLVLSGDDGITLPLIAAGAHGVISVIGNALPEKFSKMVHAAMIGDFETARPLHYALSDMVRMLFAEGNPGGVKEVLVVRGVMENHMRLPLVNVSETLKKQIVAETIALL